LFTEASADILLTVHFQHIGLVELQLVGEVVFEAVKSSLVNRAGRLPVDFYFRIGHRALKDDKHLPVAPGGGHLEGVLVHTFLVGEAEVFAVSFVVAAVVVAAEALLLPARGYLYFGPETAFAAAGAVEIPGGGVGVVGAREVANLLLRGRLGGSVAGPEQRQTGKPGQEVGFHKIAQRGRRRRLVSQHRPHFFDVLPVLSCSC
jgi:hypothetical protein